MTFVWSQNIVVYGFQQFIFLFMGRRLHAMQGVSLKLVLMKIISLLFMKSGAWNTRSFPAPRGKLDFLSLFPFLKSWFFALRFITQVSPNYQQLISWQETAALPLLLCWASPSGNIIRRVWCFLSSQQDNNCFPQVTQNCVKSLASIFAMSTQEILEDPCLNSH